MDERASLSTLPKELFADILDYLRIQSDLPAGALAIVSLAKTCRGFHDFIRIWVQEIVPAPERSQIKDLERADVFVPEDPGQLLSAYCRLLGNFCAFCSNRARHAKEMFTGIQVCQACEARFFPKISSIRLWGQYSCKNVVRVHNILDVTSHKVKTKRGNDAGIYAWSIVADLLQNGLLFLDEDDDDGEFIRSRRFFSVEEYSSFDLDEYNRRYELSKRHEYLLSPLWEEIWPKWYHGEKSPTCPLTVDMISYKEFRYRFDYAWGSPSTPLQERNEYISFAQYWAKAGVWSARPWALHNFPIPVRNSESNPYAGEFDKRDDECSFAEHQFQCAKIRSMIKVFPDILRSPNDWRRCMSMKAKTLWDVKKAAIKASTSWKKKLDRFEYVIREGWGHEQWNARLDRVAMRTNWQNGCTNFADGRWTDLGEIAIIKVNGDSAKVWGSASKEEVKKT